MAGSLPQSGVSLVAQNAGQFVSAMAGAERSLHGFGKGAGAMGQIVTGALRQVGVMVVNMAAQAAAAVGRWLVDSIGVAGDFEQTLNVLGATSGATAADLELVAQKAKELGADMTLPATSAQDAAEVMLELSKAGFSVQESMDAAKGALQLSAAAQIDAASAAQITAGAINAFNLEASDAVRIADLLAAGANASSASMTDLGAGLQQAGFAFHAAGLPVEDLVTSLAALTNVGLTGSDAGTALKNALMRLMDPTDKAAGLMKELGFSAFDSFGKMKPLPTLIADLNTALAGMTDQQRNAALGNIFLSDGMKAMIPLLELGQDGFYKLKDAVTEEGAAAAVAEAQMRGWNGAVAATQSQMETLQLVVGTLLKDALTPLLFKVAEFIPKLIVFAERFGVLMREVANSEEPLRKFLFAMQVLVPAIGGPLRLLLLLYNALKPIVTALMESSANGQGLASTLSILLGPLGATQAAIDTAVGAVQRIRDAFARVGQILAGEFSGSLAGAQGVLAGVINFVLSSVVPALATAAEWFAANLPAAIATAKAVFGDIGAFIGSLMPTIQSIISTALAIIATYWQQNGQTILTRVQGVYEIIKGVIQTVLGVIQGILAAVLGVMTGDWDTALAAIRDANTTIWNGINQFLTGILRIIASFFGMTLDEMLAKWSQSWNEISTTATTIWNGIVSTVTTQAGAIASTVASVIGGVVATWNTLFGQIKSTVDSVMNGAAQIVRDQVSAIKGSFSGITSAIDGVISSIKRLIDWLSKIEVPDILSPGSPTPFEIGLRGVDKALRQTTRTLEAQFSPAISGVLAAQSPMAAGPSTTTNYGPSYQMPIYTNQSPAVLSQGLALVEALSA